MHRATLQQRSHTGMHLPGAHPPSLWANKRANCGDQDRAVQGKIWGFILTWEGIGPLLYNGKVTFHSTGDIRTHLRVRTPKL